MPFSVGQTVFVTVDFWSRRWNLAFSEMTALGVYRPLSGNIGRKAATVAAFLASGLLHELAISLPVLAGYLFDTTHNYVTAVLIAGCANLTGMATALTMPKRGRR